MRRRTLTGALALWALCAAPGLGADGAPARSIGEREVRAISAKRYTELLRRACFNGWRFDAASVASGYRRHYEETRLALIGEGYALTPEPAVPRLSIVGMLTASTVARGTKPTCFRARWSSE